MLVSARVPSPAQRAVDRLLLVACALLLGVPFLLPTELAEPGAPVLVGVWEGPERRLRFRADGTFLLTPARPGSELPAQEGEYVLETDTRPMALTLRNVRGLSHAIHASVRFRGDRVLELTAFAPAWRLRPLSFGDAEAEELRRLTP